MPSSHSTVDYHTNYVYEARALDKYFEQRVKQVEHNDDLEIDPRLISIVERMLDRQGFRDKDEPGQA